MDRDRNGIPGHDFYHSGYYIPNILLQWTYAESQLHKSDGFLLGRLFHDMFPVTYQIGIDEVYAAGDRSKLFSQVREMSR